MRLLTHLLRGFAGRGDNRLKIKGIGGGGLPSKTDGGSSLRTFVSKIWAYSIDPGGSE